jgi:hypothetical protein
MIEPDPVRKRSLLDREVARHAVRTSVGAFSQNRLRSPATVGTSDCPERAAAVRPWV